MRCPDGCDKCLVDKFNQTICTSCDSNYALLNGKCEFCSYGCQKCVINENNNTSCLECYYNNYALIPNNTCTNCGNVDYLGDGCERCIYNKTLNKYQCIQCNEYFNPGTSKYFYMHT